jgi:hypothetical protein
MHQHRSKSWASRSFTRDSVHARGCGRLHNYLFNIYSNLELGEFTPRRQAGTCLILVANAGLHVNTPPPMHWHRDLFATLLRWKNISSSRCSASFHASPSNRPETGALICIVKVIIQVFVQ